MGFFCFVPIINVVNCNKLTYHEKTTNYFAFLILGLTSVAQTTKSYYNSGNTSTTKKFVGASWLPGTILLADGSEIVVKFEVMPIKETI